MYKHQSSITAISPQIIPKHEISLTGAKCMQISPVSSLTQEPGVPSLFTIIFLKKSR